MRLQGGWDPDGLGRYTVLGVDPYAIITARDGAITYRDAGGRRRWHQDPFSALAAAYEGVRRRRWSDQLPFPFQGGGMGFFGYELGRFSALGRLDVALRQSELGLPDLFFAFYDAAAVYDHRENCTYLLSSGLPLMEDEAVSRARRRMDELLQWVDEGFQRMSQRRGGSRQSKETDTGTRTEEADAHQLLDPRHSSLSKSEYLHMVRRAKEYIAAGEIQQVNLAQRFRFPVTADPRTLFEALRVTNPAPFGAYIRGRGWSVISVSPERFFHYDGRRVETRPIKGTRPRSDDARQDQALQAELLQSSKDRAEHTMIVDLMASDLGRFCRAESVRVSKLMTVEAHPTVWHLVSSVVGEPKYPEEIIEGVRACFPGGSITGAPKVRAMEIIAQLEPVARGVYTGAIGYLGAGGRVDLNVAIRTLTLRGGYAYFHVGGGIVADSEPEAEYQESLDKGLGIARALASLEGSR